jgi:hypothetical protein
VATYKELSDADIRATRSFLNQLVDFVEQDISGSATRKSYQVFVTGGVGPGVTSSLFQTVYDQDYTLQTSNALFDMTMGIRSGSATVATASTGQDANGKLLFSSQSLMMREKVNLYRQYAQLLKGDADSSFTAPFSNPGTSDTIDEALFINFKRLFVRDGVKRETFAMKFYQSASDADVTSKNNVYVTPVDPASGSAIFTDVGSSTSIETSETGGSVGNIVDASNTSRTVGLMFYNQGIAVLDLKKIVSASQHMSGVISAMSNVTDADASTGQTVMGSASGNPNAKFIPDFVTSGSIDDIVNHIATSRFSSGSLTTMTFQNNTQINSTIVFCRATADEFNYSTNPTYTDTDGRLVVIDSGQEGFQKSFSFITSVGLFDANDELLAVAKLSRPVEKNDEKDLTFRVRLDF